MDKSDQFFFEIVSPNGKVYEGHVKSVALPSVSGQIEILPHHTPLFTRLSEGEVEITTTSNRTSFVIAGGFLEIKKGSAHVLSDYAVRAESIEQAKALERQRKAEEKMKQKLSNEEFTLADKDLKLSILELKVAQKIKRKHTG